MSSKHYVVLRVTYNYYLVKQLLKFCLNLHFHAPLSYFLNLEKVHITVALDVSRWREGFVVISPGGMNNLGQVCFEEMGVGGNYGTEFI